MQQHCSSGPYNFYPRPPRGGRRVYSGGVAGTVDISIHALREEGDDHLDAAYEPLNQFLSTPSARRATIKKAQEPDNVQFLSTPSARRATDAKAFVEVWRKFLSTPSARRATLIAAQEANDEQISIHALREEGDLVMFVQPAVIVLISIHALREEGDRTIFSHGVHGLEFLSTPSARRATSASGSSRLHGANFYPRPPRGGRPFLLASRRRPLAFLSTPSARRATRTNRVPALHQEISIHALREEGDPA